jgi:SAM-dependent methyltransferase
VYKTLYGYLKSLKSGTNDESNGRHIIPDEAIRASRKMARPRILDVGAGRGADLAEIALALKQTGRTPELFAVESFPISIEALDRLGVKVESIDIEYTALPFDEKFFDVVICNQVLEHTKEIFWVISEIARVMKRGGTLILGVPNLASLHNRLALLAGYQPPAIAVFGPHVRGFTIPDLRDFLQSGGILKVKKVMGGNFYPFPPKVSRPLTRLLPSFAVSSFYIAERVGDGSFLGVLETERASLLADTPYFRGGCQSTPSQLVEAAG